MSELAALRQQIALECEASWQALHGVAIGVARHEIIRARFATMEVYHERLVELTGEEQAAEILCETYNDIARKQGQCTEMSNTISPALLEKLRQKSAVSSYSGTSWECYALILQHINEAIQRIPELAALEACNDADIDRILEAELEALASLVAEIFPGGLTELAYYLKTPMT